MSELVFYGVGTTIKGNEITGIKDSFNWKEPIIAGHYWTGLGRDQKLSIRFIRDPDGIAEFRNRCDWQTSTWDKAHFQTCSPTEKINGLYEAQFLQDDSIFRRVRFTITGGVEPDYPKTITQTGYSFKVINLTQEKIINEFLGIEPPGLPLDEWLALRTLEQLTEWRNFWQPIFFDADLTQYLEFLEDKLEEYKEKFIPILPPKKTWWKKLLGLLTSSPFLGLLTSEDLFKSGYLLLTGKEISDAEYELKKLQFADWVLPINLLMKLFEGRNLKGEAEEFGSASDWIESGIYLVGAIIPGNVDETAAKLGLKTITKAEASKLTATMGKKAVVDNLIRTVKAHPTTSAKLLAKYPKPVTDAVFSGLYKTAWGREAVYTLGKTGFYKYNAPVWKQVISTMMAWTKPVIAITLPIFAITEIPNLFNMMQFARKQKLEAEGKWPSDIAFKLNDYENIIKNYTYEIDRKIVAKDKAGADDLLKKLMNVIEDYRNYIEEKKEDMLKDNYDLALLNLEFYEGFVSDRITKIAELPIEAPIPTTLGSLILSVEPADAIIEVAGQAEIAGSGTFELAPGSYVIKASKENYWDKSSTAIIKAGKETKTSIILTELTKPAPIIPPEEVLGTLTISVTPEDAIIEVAGEAEITTSGTYDLKPGSYGVRALKEGFVTDIKTAIVSEKKDTAISFILEAVIPTPPITEKATITITSDPTNADVYIDGVYKWATTPYTILFDAGSYFVRVQKDGYYPVEVEIEVEAGEVAELPFVLEEIPEPEIPAYDYVPQTPYYPTYEPAEPYVPAYVSTPPAEIPPYNYSNLNPPAFSIAEPEPYSKPLEKELLINIETTDVYPWKGRIYSIAYLDLTNPNAEIKVLSGDNEEELVKMFIDWFDAGNYSKLVGFKLTFDHRYIFSKMMLYRIQNKAFAQVGMRDVKQLLDQVKEEFVYYPDKKGTLDDWGKMLLGRGKYGAQELMLRKYISGDFEYVQNFQIRQIELTRDLYNLARYSMGEAFISSPTPVSTEISPILAPESIETPGIQGKKTCPICKAYNPLSASVCEICGAAI